jgi:hypothetical protein
VAIRVFVIGGGAGVAKLLGISVDGCGPDGCAVVAFSHAAIDAPLAKSAPDIANAVSILRVLKRDTIGNMLAFRQTSFVRYSCNNKCCGADRVCIFAADCRHPVQALE